MRSSNHGLAPLAMNDRNDGSLRAKRCFGENCIENVNRLFAQRSAMNHTLSDAARAAEDAFRMSAMEAAMQCLDAQGAFDAAPKRNARRHLRGGVTRTPEHGKRLAARSANGLDRRVVRGGPTMMPGTSP